MPDPAKPTSAKGDSESIQETIFTHIRKTLNVVQSIKGNTEKLLQRTDNIVELLAEQDSTPPAPDGPVEVEIDEVVEAEEAEPVPDPTAQIDPALVQAISKACVLEVMAKVNPVLEHLHKFIQANKIDKPQPQDIDDDAFAEKLIEEMKLSLGRRQRIALARKRMSAP